MLIYCAKYVQCITFIKYIDYYQPSFYLLILSMRGGGAKNFQKVFHINFFVCENLNKYDLLIL